jgi:hypothetical protein
VVVRLRPSQDGFLEVVAFSTKSLLRGTYELLVNEALFEALSLELRQTVPIITLVYLPECSLIGLDLRPECTLLLLQKFGNFLFLLQLCQLLLLLPQQLLRPMLDRNIAMVFMLLLEDPL